MKCVAPADMASAIDDRRHSTDSCNGYTEGGTARIISNANHNSGCAPIAVPGVLPPLLATSKLDHHGLHRLGMPMEHALLQGVP